MYHWEDDCKLETYLVINLLIRDLTFFCEWTLLYKEEHKKI